MSVNKMFTELLCFEEVTILLVLFSSDMGTSSMADVASGAFTVYNTKIISFLRSTPLMTR